MPLVTVTLTTALFTHSRTLSISNESTPRPTNLKQEVGLLKPKVALLYRRMVLVCLRYPHLPAAIPLHQSAIIGSPLIGISDRSPHWLLILSQIPPRGSNSGCILSPPFDLRLHRRIKFPRNVRFFTAASIRWIDVRGMIEEFLLNLLSGARVAISALWIGLLQSSILPHGHTWLLPIYFIVSLGCYGLLMVGIGLMTFPTCPAEGLLLQKDVDEAKEYLKKKGVDINSN
ncbi:dolichol-phosphate mannosyltransferase subunit 3 [Cucumis melo var. makuwa]|uniref:Dolichol-phosphate mannosyltransferase subunit 3 n=1 Tax=Cucumis melo var. makuwa TaxID=1194695 RepID=A0A5D3CIP9_CUCMM|nr:dolichol-phosphate mannosyltransferase subunit 3 [Cucumis melo var. makuwa]